MTTPSEEHQYPDTIDVTDLERMIEAGEKAMGQVRELAAMMDTAFQIAMEPLRDRLGRLENKYNLRPARVEKVQTEEEETSND